MPWLLIRARRDRLESQLKTTTARARTAIVAAEAGFSELGEYLRKRYEVDGLSVMQIRNETGLHNQKVAGLLRAAGTARRDNPATAERAVLDRIGWSGSLADYVIDRDRAGMSIQKMSWELGRSDGWVARRLRAAGHSNLIRPPGHRG